MYNGIRLLEKQPVASILFRFNKRIYLGDVKIPGSVSCMKCGNGDVCANS